MSHDFLRIGRPPQGPPVKPHRKPRASHWVDWLPNAISAVLIWAWILTAQ